MDPLLFGINPDVVVEVLTMIILLALIIERALSVLFEWRRLIEKLDSKGIKEPVALIVSFAVVVNYKFDALAIVFSNESNSYFGYFVTAAVIAGGSKGAIKLFRDWMGWKSQAQKDKEEVDKAKSAARVKAIGAS